MGDEYESAAVRPPLVVEHLQADAGDLRRSSALAAGQCTLLSWVLLFVGILELTFGFVGAVHGRAFVGPLITGCALLLLAFAQPLKNWLPVPVAHEVTLASDGMTFALRGRTAPLVVPWRRVRSVVRGEAGFRVGLRTIGVLVRWIYVPMPASPVATELMWERLYQTLVAPRGLCATTPERRTFIENTAYAR
jgi:hypothetical protein